MQDDPEARPITVADIDTATDDAPVLASDTVITNERLRSILSEIGIEKDDLLEENKSLERKVTASDILNSLIKPYADKTFIFMCAYCGMVFAILLMDGCGYSSFKLPESVLKFLVGSTATTVIGLVGMVLTGIFVGARGRDNI